MFIPEALDLIQDNQFTSLLIFIFTPTETTNGEKVAYYGQTCTHNNPMDVP